jgi:hypothetical protein
VSQVAVHKALVLLVQHERRTGTPWNRSDHPGGDRGEFRPLRPGRSLRGWTRSVTDAASRPGVTATPTILVNGQEIARSDEALRAACIG